MARAMRPSSQGISIATSTQRIPVDNRLSLRCYYRIADNLLKQADIYREERNIIDLYIILLRFSSLITETLPQHRDYHSLFLGEKISFRKRLLNVLSELETLKPNVQRRIEELSRKSRHDVNRWGQTDQLEYSFDRYSNDKQAAVRYGSRQVAQPFAQKSFEVNSQVLTSYRSRYSLPDQAKEQHRKLSLAIPRAKEETLSRHSILGPGGLHGQWPLVKIDRKVEYPSNLDFSPIEYPCLQQPKPDDSILVKDSKPDDSSLVKDTATNDAEKALFDSVISLHDELPSVPSLESSTNPIEGSVNLDIPRDPQPPPVLAEVQDLATLPSSIAGESTALEDEIIRSEPLQVHISGKLMDDFMRLAKSNTERNLETCGVLAGSLKNRKFFVTALIIPKQESTSDTCQTTNEEEIFEYQDKKSLFPLGWIHTHPTQSCFMSSVDVHTHYSYQIMLPEAIAIVMAPRDLSRTHGIFRLTTPGGISVIRKCQRRGFHSHEPPLDGSPIYEKCSDVYVNPNLNFDVVDFR